MDVTTKAIRYYESIGLLDEPARTESGYRSYGPEAIERLQFVKQAQSSGLALTEIKSILEIKDQGGQSCEHTRELLKSPPRRTRPQDRRTATGASRTAQDVRTG